ncbi:hypothetical protein LTR35_011394 [Friedmanniomyces endolithicus]|uniref:Pentacotripeptide-repeat region of PRORP domain-containing protein n=1 Tax=Friedmanniomyces endolithicus TaxID=329885 RepID=A0AAN6FFZ4_9PEZI|nr:hypothetical protein LTR35_011394 [Friedmanniomyces endolithicus]KAK0291617.1 hypothetical protein LTS00_008309 [Friedmanniomyces endolithicus]KAK0317712.1 hypothetical protein LTR82_011229 [Friedmanniomyces endolithicus]
MPSHLTRAVFRGMLANEPIVHRGCLRARRLHRKAGSCTTSTTTTTERQQRRSFFNMGMFRKRKRETKEADMDPGLETMMQLEKLTRLRARLPLREDVAKAFVDFFQAKYTAGQPVEDNQAKLALQSLRYCLGDQDTESDGADKPLFSGAKLQQAAVVLRNNPTQTTFDHVELARILHERLKDVSYASDEAGIRTYVRLLWRTSSASTARDAVLDFERRRGPVELGRLTPPSSEDIRDVDTGGNEVAKQAHPSFRPIHLRRLWVWVLRAWSTQGEDAEVARTLATISERGLQNGLSVHHAMLMHSISKNDGKGIEKWWRAQCAMTPPASETDILYSSFVRDALTWCLANDHVDLGHSIVRDLMQTSPMKPVWDAIFVWAAGTGKGVDEIGRMLDVMERANEGMLDKESWRRPDTATINALVEYAISKDDPYTAERFIALGRDRGIEPDARTYVLQMAYRLGVNDIDGALTAYKNLQTMDLSSDEDIPAVNKLIVALCSSKQHDFDTIMNVAGDLSDRRARFEPRTVATLALLHLDRDELHDVIDLLNTHAYHYSSTERNTVRDMIVAYCLDANTPVFRSWDAYLIIRDVFDELNREARTELMTNFFARDRPDMAVHVFNHMRAHSRADTMPTPDTYITAFLGTAKRQDLESLEVVHNQMKLDFNINLTTRLRNALVIAYTACGRARKALQFWDAIVASREGPSYNSIHVALRACERSPFGDLKAKEIWGKLRKMNVDLDSTMWASYIAALAGNGDCEGAIKVLEEAVGKGEVEVDAFVLGSLFAGSTGSEKQSYVEQWAKEEHPRAWSELEKFGAEEAEDGTRAFEIDRSVTP